MRHDLATATLLVAVVLLGCQRRLRHEVAPAASVSAIASAATPASAAPEASAQPPAEARGSFARFTKDSRLFECFDVVIHPAPGRTLPADAMQQFETRTKLKDTPLDVSCAEQFGTRPPLAACGTFLHVADAGSGAGIELREYYYDVDALARDDALMKECLELHGNWRGPDPSSAAWRDAQHEARARRANGLIDQLGKQSTPAAE